MIVDDLRIDDRNGLCELSARVRETRLAPSGERIWFRLPGELRPKELDASPYLPGLLLACMWLHEPLVIDGPVSARLLAAADRAQEIYRGWEPRLAGVRVEAEPRELEPGPPAAACFFTRGVDSWFSVLNGEFKTLLYSPTSDFVVGRPTKAAQRELRAEAAALAREASERVGRELVLVDSNLRELVEPHRPWAWSHGALLGSLGLALGSNFGRVHIASTFTIGYLVPNGSHPDLDPLFSTERTEIVHDGADVSRLEKVRFLADHPAALERLKVCINQSADANCGRCGKCVRLMIGLRLAEPLQASPSFDEPLQLRNVMRVPARLKSERVAHRYLLKEVRRAGGNRRIAAALWCAGALGRVPGGVRGAKRLRGRVRRE